MTRLLQTAVFLLASSCHLVCCADELQKLRVSDNNRYLVTEDGSPFFYLGDTAWELFHRLNREDANAYVEDRASKGFTVIQAVALAELDGLNTPNVYGHRPLVDNDPARPDVKPGERNDYWDHVDFIVDKAEALGMYIALLPTWGDKWNRRGGIGPEVFTPENAKVYGQWLGRRYRDEPIIWILGGDRTPTEPKHFAIIRAMAEGLEKGSGGRQLMTFHPSGRGNSADLFHNDEWLDFNMIQSGHSRPATPNCETALKNLARSPLKPTLDGEPCYEDHPVKGDAWHRRNQPGVLLDWFDEWNVRQAAYLSMLAGACGHTYGDHNIWQMWLPKHEPLSVARTPWYEALHHPGSRQMKFFRGLFEARPFWEMRPDQSLIIDAQGEGWEQVRAARHLHGKFAVIYLPMGQAATISLDKLSGATIRATWFNPRQNSAQLIGEIARQGQREFTPPTQGRNNDWVLVIDDASEDLPRLGYSHQNLIPKVGE